MLISRDRRVLFIHIQKTGGRSIRQILCTRLPDAESFLGTHDHAKWARPQFPRADWNRFFKFAFVRNPWERLVSWYSMITQVVPILPPQDVNKLSRYVLSNASTFEEFLDRCTATIEDSDGVKSFLYNQLDYISDERGRILVDFVGKYEHFERDVQEVMKRLMIDDAVIPRENTRSLSRNRRDLNRFEPCHG